MERAAYKSVAKTVFAVGLWAALHSILATRTVKRAATKRLGQQASNGLYRLTYNAVAISTGGGVFLYVHRLPDEELYRLTGVQRTAAALLRCGLVGVAVWGALEIGAGPFSGLTEALGWLQGKPVPPAPEAQGPSAEQREGHLVLKTSGPFRYVRHPLNASLTGVVFLTPRMTAVRLTVAVLTLLYSVIGSRLEEARLLDVYGSAYERYRTSGVPFMLPRL
jgi:protein-S-isoprenylcysteine O-methyltransferase Ste14